MHTIRIEKEAKEWNRTAISIAKQTMVSMNQKAKICFTFSETHPEYQEGVVTMIAETVPSAQVKTKCAKYHSMMQKMY